MNSRYLITSPTNEDPLGIRSVSGFYGPGTWAGWILAIATAWFNTFSRPRSRRVEDAIVYLLGTNWAAIDLMRQMYSVRASGVDGKQGAVAAALLVTYWGLVTALSQFFWCLINSEVVEKNIPVRGLFLFAGSLLPSIALASLLFSVGPLVPVDSENDHWPQFAETLPAFYGPGINNEIILRSMPGIGVYAATYICLACIAIVKHSLRARARPESTQFKTNAEAAFDAGTVLGPGFLIGTLLFALLAVGWTWVVPFYALGAIAGFMTMGFGWVLVLYLLGISLINHKDSCFVRPCAPQRLGEWDQTFALLAGLIIFGVEVGPSIWRWTRRTWGL